MGRQDSEKTILAGRRISRRGNRLDSQSVALTDRLSEVRKEAQPREYSQ